MEKENEIDEEARRPVNCPNCGKPMGEGTCHRCANYRLVVKFNGGVMVLT